MEFVSVRKRNGAIEVRINFDALVELCEDTEMAVNMAGEIADRIIMKAYDYRTVANRDKYVSSYFNLQEIAKNTGFDESVVSDILSEFFRTCYGVL